MIENALARAFKSNQHNFLIREILGLFELNDFLGNIDTDHIVELSFTGMQGFNLSLVDRIPESKELSKGYVKIPNNLLVERLEILVEGKYILNHPELSETTNADFQDLEALSSHMEEGCIVCRETYLRSIQALNQFINDEMDFYSREIFEIAEELITQHANYLNELLINAENNESEDTIMIIISFDISNLGELEELEFVYDIRSELPEIIISQLPELLREEITNNPELLVVSRLNTEISINSRIFGLICKYTVVEPIDVIYYLIKTIFQKVELSQFKDFIPISIRNQFNYNQERLDRAVEIISDFEVLK